MSPESARSRYERGRQSHGTGVIVETPANREEIRAIVKTDWESLSAQFGQEIANNPDGLHALFIVSADDYPKIAKGASLVWQTQNRRYSVNSAKPMDPGSVVVCWFLLGVQAVNQLPDA